MDVAFTFDMKPTFEERNKVFRKLANVTRRPVKITWSGVWCAIGQPISY